MAPWEIIYQDADNLRKRPDCPKDIKQGIDWYFQILNRKHPVNDTNKKTWYQHCAAGNFTGEVHGIVACMFGQNRSGNHWSGYMKEKI